jgi:drug/metabolite transporter (DMT)-like permease
MAKSIGFALAATTGVIWGGQWVVGKSALAHVNAFNLTTIRYAAAAAILLAVLVAVEGRRALRTDGHALRLFALGTLGFAGFNLLAYVGLQHARAESASLITSLGPLLMAVVLWSRGEGRPARSTVVALTVAIAGVALVIGRGHPLSIFTGALGWGDLLVLAGVAGFLVYTVGARDLPGFSPLRFTALTATFGWVSIAVVTAVADGVGAASVPSAANVTSALPQIAYITILGAVVAVTTWNLAAAKIGPQNVALFTSVMPVTTFAIEIARGYRPGALEVGGASLTVAALIGGNIATRGVRVRRAQPDFGQIAGVRSATSQRPQPG